MLDVMPIDGGIGGEDNGLALGGADKRAYDHHVQDGVSDGIKKWETKTREAREQLKFH